MENGYVFIGESIFPTLLAISEMEQSRGLMWQEWPPPVMSFIYGAPRQNTFWMKNTPSPLDIVFTCKGKVTQICKGEPYSTNAIGGWEASDLIVELPYGTAKSSGIKVGQSVGLVAPTFDELRKIVAEKYPGIVKI